MTTAIVEGSWGRLEVDCQTGNVLKLTDEPEYQTHEIGYRDIVRVDVDKYRATFGKFAGCDILDIGYWTKEGVYEPPTPFEERCPA